MASTLHPLVFELQQEVVWEKLVQTRFCLFCAISFIFCHACFLQLTFLYNKNIAISQETNWDKKQARKQILFSGEMREVPNNIVLDGFIH